MKRAHISRPVGQPHDEQLLDLLRAREDDFVSGAELADALGVSRTTVWNHIQALRAEGYVVDACTHRGYRLVSVPDRLLPNEVQRRLRTRWIGRTLWCYRETDSTNDIALDRAVEGAPEGAVVLAEAQRRGRGRFHRTWLSPPGANILASVILRPEVHPNLVSQLVITAAVAAAETLNALYKLDAHIKWPNDVYIGGRKIAGILAELSAEAEQTKHVVIGIGLNVNMTRAQLPRAVRSTATSVHIEIGRTVSRLDVLAEFLARIETGYERWRRDGFAPAKARWVALSSSVGRRVEIVSGTTKLTGLVADLDDDGALILRLDSGLIRKAASGDMTVVG
ncbi:MAG: biotin--[acetyl-CoA-carboxylase] ligase [Verrucomicrobia bacterium]|nr:biotin--[acetyl-CoA-carboxylase] ligase [Verrucomicrobiota bacterium]